MSSTSENPPAPCISCGEMRTGRFCASCGEKVVEPEDYSVKTFLQDILHAFLTTESSTWRSFIMLLTKPGQMTVDYLAGKRIGYLKPLQLFLFCNVLFFFAHSYIDINTFTTPLQVQMHRLPHSAMAAQMVNESVAQKNISFAKYEARFNDISNTQAKTLVIGMVPLWALVLQLLLWRPKRFYGEHLVFSLHFFAFVLLALPSVLAVLYCFGLTQERVLDYVFLAVFSTYLFVAIRRVYDPTLVWAVLRTLVAFVGLMVVVMLYRLLLFFVAYYSI